MFQTNISSARIMKHARNAFPAITIILNIIDLRSDVPSKLRMEC